MEKYLKLRYPCIESNGFPVPVAVIQFSFFAQLSPTPRQIHGACSGGRSSDRQKHGRRPPRGLKNADLSGGRRGTYEQSYTATPVYSSLSHARTGAPVIDSIEEACAAWALLQEAQSRAEQRPIQAW